MRPRARPSCGASIGAMFVALIATVGPGSSGRVREAVAAPARTMKPETRAALNRALASYEKGEFDAASATLREAIASEPHPDLYYMLGQSERRAGRCDEAVEAYRAFLASGPPQSEADLARSNIDRCVPAKPAPPLRPSPTDDDEPPPRAAASTPPTTADAAEESGVARVVLPIVGGALVVFGGVALGLGEVAASSADEAKTLDAFRGAATRTDVWRVTGGLSIAAGVALAAGTIVSAITGPSAPKKKDVSLLVGPGFVGVAGEL